MDVSVNEESIEKAVDILKELPQEFDIVKKAAQEAKKAVDDIGDGSSFYDYSSVTDRCVTNSAGLIDNLVESLGLLKVSKSFEAGEATTIYDSYYGVENEAAYNIFKKIYENLLKSSTSTGSKAASKKAEKTEKFSNLKDYIDFMQKVNNYKHLSKITEKKDSLEEKFKEWAGDKFDKDYKAGKKLAFETIDLYKWKLVDYSKASYEIGDDEGNLKWGVRANARDASISASIGPGHVKLDASAEYNLLKANASYQSPALQTKDGLEVLSASANGEISVCHAEASAKAVAGRYTDEKTGRKYWDIGANFKAEADLVKIDGSVSGTVAGVTGTVSGGVKIGLGAEASVGWSGGKLKCNLSLAAGFGFEVGFSLDFSKVSNYVSGKIDKYGKKFASYLSG